MDAKETVETKEQRIFAGTHCSLLGFEFEFNNEQLDFNGLAKDRGWKLTKHRFRNFCGSRDKSIDYHLHLAWKIAPDCLEVRVSFVHGYGKPDEGEREPFAEGFIDWFRQFVLTKESRRVGMHADFEIPRSDRRLLFPLPLRAPVGPGQVQVEIDGFSFQVSPPVEGIEKMWVTRTEEKVVVHLHAQKILGFASLNPRNEILTFGKVVGSLFEKKLESEGRLQ